MSQDHSKQVKPQKPVPTYEESELAELKRYIKSDLNYAWAVLDLFKDNPALQIKYPFLQLHARERVARNQDYYRLGRFVGQATRQIQAMASQLLAMLFKVIKQPESAVAPSLAASSRDASWQGCHLVWTASLNLQQHNYPLTSRS